MDRKTFIKKTTGAVLMVLLVSAIIGCSNADDGSENLDTKEATQSKCFENGAVGSIEMNHGHILAIPKEDVVAAKQKTYTIQGDADHSHTIIVTSADFTSLKNKNSLSIVDIYSSTDNDHRHSVIVFCAP